MMFEQTTHCVPRVSQLVPRCSVFFFNDTATTEIYTLSLHDALPIYIMRDVGNRAIMDIRNDLYAHTAIMPMRFFTQQSTGKLMSRILNDVSLINNAVSTSIK